MKAKCCNTRGGGAKKLVGGWKFLGGGKFIEGVKKFWGGVKDKGMSKKRLT